ncbi:glycoside hydrolase family 16 protein [Didymella exigua CBS 183.55]|uniref:Glycoside hydrolase family 16 protein n=1 Tax=Didymella exigua CBS 183.55 TaxID=1150837 RepID=A0A6A5REQ9_9PLEO|nr:glycoside hydrolase family 16 protein [Didymella exigua CBS 183.55]KAF1925919.1 glycoside hydrolase family 16 protein [Didymella exigua CBS 183.55]
MPSLSALLGVGAATLFSVASATKYTPADTYSGSSFFDNFNFVTEEKTNGFVKYVDRTTAQNKGYIGYDGGDAVFGVDYKSKLNSAAGGDFGRESVRLEGKKEYNKGLFVLDLKHMPGGICGTWPAFWSLGREPWPVKGEIDIIEGVNQNTNNNFVLHTDTKCKVNGLGQTGTQALTDCALDGPSKSTGCGVTDARGSSFGKDFNAAQGGYYVTEWQAEGIKIWFFPRGSQPRSLLSDEPDTTTFGTPAASFQGDCDIEKRFMDQRFIFTNTFCGDWGGNVYAQSGCPMYQGLDGMGSCKKYVAENPEVFKDAYWRVSSFKTYNKRAITSSSSVAPSSTSHASSSSVQVSPSSVQVSPSSVQVSPSSVQVSSSSAYVSSSSAHVSSSSVHVSSSSTHVSSSLVAHSSSALSSSTAHSSSATSTPYVPNSVYPSSTPVASSSYSADVSSAISSSAAHDYSSTVSSTASSTPYDHVSSSSAAHDYSSGISSSVSEASYASASDSASETPYSHDISSTISSASASETPYVRDSSSIYASASSSYVVPSDVFSVYPSETPYSSSSTAYSSETPYSSTSSSSAYPDVSSHPADSESTSSTPVYSTSAPDYSVYPEGDGYNYGDKSSKTPDPFPTTSEYSTISAKVNQYDSYPTASTKSVQYDNYLVASSSAPVYGHNQPKPSVKSTPVYSDYPGLPSFTPLYSTYPEISSKPSYDDDKKSTDSYTTTAYQTTYVDVCPTGYTTITTKVTAIQTSAPYPTTNAYYAPPGFEVTTKYCAQGCGEGPKTVTVTIPCTKCQATGVPNKPASSAPSVPSKPTDTPNKPTSNTPYTPAQPSKPSTPEDSTSKVTSTKIITLTKIPVPESQYYATNPSVASPSASMIKYPDSDSDKSYADKPVAPSSAVHVGGDKPVYPTVVGHPGSNVTISYGTATSIKGDKPTQTGYKIPEFTGAASAVQVGGVVAGAIAAFAALLM